MLSNLRFAFRQIVRTPGFSLIAILTLALGIGANTAFFSVINDSLLRPLPYPNQERLVHLDETTGSFDRMTASYPNFQDWHRQQDVFSSLAFFFSTGAKLKTPERVERISLGMITSDFFSVLGTPMLQGRAPNADDDKESATPVAWLTYGAWQKYFAAAPDLVGKPILIDGHDLVVAGILPAGFRFTRNAEIYVPVAPYAEQNFLTLRASHNDSLVLGLLKPGTTLALAQTEMTAIASRLQREYPAADAGIGVRLSPLRERIAGDSRTNLLLLCGAVGTVLLIACVNIANMLLARSFSRTHEMAIRTALGATRRQLIRQLLTESIVLAFLGGVAGTLIGAWGHGLVGRLVPSAMQPLLENSIGLDPRVLAFTLGITLLTGLGFGLAPAWQLSHINPLGAIKRTPVVLQTRWGRWHLRDLLVAVQVALALILLVGAGLLIRSLQHLLEVDPGIRPAQVLSLQITAPPTEAFQKDPNAFPRFYQEAVETIRNLPGVESCAAGSNLPFTWSNSSMMFYLEGKPLPEAGKLPVAGNRSVTREYFQTLGIPLLRGRVFDGHEPVPNFPPGVAITPETLSTVFKDVSLQAVISRRMAEQFWPGEDAIGKRFHLGNPEMHLPVVDVIGIVGDTTRNGLENGPTAEFYLSLRQFAPPSETYLILRTQSDPAGIASAVRSALNKVFPDHPVYDLRPMNDRLEERIAGRKFNLHLYIFFAGTALLLAIVGLYGVLAFVVGQRTREIGIRMALGANQGDVLMDMLKRGLLLVVPGLLLGAVAAWIASRFLQSQLYAITRNDPVSYVVAAGLLLLAAIVACLLPARRATRINPIEALRTE